MNRLLLMELLENDRIDREKFQNDLTKLVVREADERVWHMTRMKAFKAFMEKTFRNIGCALLWRLETNDIIVTVKSIDFGNMEIPVSIADIYDNKKCQSLVQNILVAYDQACNLKKERLLNAWSSEKKQQVVNSQTKIEQKQISQEISLTEEEIEKQMKILENNSIILENKSESSPKRHNRSKRKNFSIDS